MRPPASKPSRAMPAWPRSRSTASSSNKEDLFREVVHRAVSSARETMQATLVQRRRRRQGRCCCDLVERMYLGATEAETLALLRLVIAEAVRFPELAKSLYAENSYVLAPVVEYLAEAHRAASCTCPIAELAAVQLVDAGFRRRALLHLQAAGRPRGAPRLGRRRGRSGAARAGCRRPRRAGDGRHRKPATKIASALVQCGRVRRVG